MESDSKTIRGPILGLRTVVYKVGDIAEATAWYAKAFKTEPYFEEPFYVGFNIADYELGLQPDQQNENPKSKNCYVYWGVEDIRAEFDRLISLGARVDEEPNNVGGELMVASVLDPWDNVIGIIYNPYFELK